MNQQSFMLSPALDKAYVWQLKSWCSQNIWKLFCTENISLSTNIFCYLKTNCLLYRYFFHFYTYFLEIYWKSETALVFWKAFAMNFTLESMYLKPGLLFMCSLRRMALGKLCEWESDQPGLVSQNAPIHPSQLHPRAKGEVGSLGVLVTSQLPLLTYLGWPWMCDHFDVLQYRSRGLIVHDKAHPNVMKKQLRGEKPCSEKNEAPWF